MVAVPQLAADDHGLQLLGRGRHGPEPLPELDHVEAIGQQLHLELDRVPRIDRDLDDLIHIVQIVDELPDVLLVDDVAGRRLQRALRDPVLVLGLVPPAVRVVPILRHPEVRQDGVVLVGEQQHAGRDVRRGRKVQADVAPLAQQLSLVDLAATRIP